MYQHTKSYSQLFKCLFLCVLSFTASHVAIYANTTPPDEEALIKSMEERLPALMELKLKGKVGETNMGLVEARIVVEREQRRMLSDENRDRLAHYNLIAKKLGVPVSAVQRKRAQQIRENSPRGIWIESKSGDWYRE